MSCDPAVITEEWLKYFTKQICIVGAVTENKIFVIQLLMIHSTEKHSVWRFIYKTNCTTCIFHCQLKLIKSIASPPKTNLISVRFRWFGGISTENTVSQKLFGVVDEMLIITLWIWIKKRWQFLNPCKICNSKLTSLASTVLLLFYI